MHFCVVCYFMYAFSYTLWTLQTNFLPMTITLYCNVLYCCIQYDKCIYIARIWTITVNTITLNLHPTTMNEWNMSVKMAEEREREREAVFSWWRHPVSPVGQIVCRRKVLATCNSALLTWRTRFVASTRWIMFSPKFTYHVLWLMRSSLRRQAHDLRRTVATKSPLRGQPDVSGMEASLGGE